MHKADDSFSANLDGDDYYRNQIECRLFGLQRSGNHAVVGWIAQQFTNPVFFFNNISHFKDPISCWHYGHVNNTHKLPPKGSDELERIRYAKKDVLIISYENMRLNQIEKTEVVPNHDHLLGRSLSIKHVLLLRDFFNWISSRLKLYDYLHQFTDDHIKRVETLAAQWLIYAREYVGLTNYFGINGVVRISYSEWVRDHLYRASILTELEIPNIDNSINYIPNVGGGSSFDGVNYSGNAALMGIHDRSAFFLEDNRYHDAREILKKKRSEIEALNREIFGLSWLL